MKYFIISLLVFLFSMATRSLCFKCEPLDDKLQKLCSNVGYNITASFPTENGVRYQDKVYSKIQESYNLFSKCSKLSNLMVCSRFVPKCLEDEKEPFLPCKDVCEEFVQDCAQKLGENNLKRFYSALCHLLPNYKENEDKCLRPQGFKRRSNVIENLPNCSSIVSHCNNVSMVPDSMVVNSGGAIPNKQCVQSLKEISCLKESPCMSSNVLYQPCRSFCDKVQKNCSAEKAKLNVSLIECSDLPDKDGNGNFCKLEQWPVPWPNKTKDTLTCYCDNCGPNKLCQTNGSCFIQTQLTNKEMITERTCLPPGKERDFICQHAQDYTLAKCCREDYCNKEIKGLFTTPATTTQPQTKPRNIEVMKTEEKADLNTTNQIELVATSPTTPSNSSSTNLRALDVVYMSATGIFLLKILQN